MHGLSETEAAERPMLFLHLENTAETWLLPALQNRFGDARVLRLHGADARLQDTIDDLVANRFFETSCLAGAVPVHYFAPHLDRFRPFTVLHEPIARVFSLYRRLRHVSDADLETLRLRRGFDFEAFIGSRTLALYAQVNNPMCRLLCGEPQMSDPDSPGFWRIDPDPALAERALAILGKFDFGLAEQIAATRGLLEARWGLAVGPDQCADDPAAGDDGAENIDHLQMVIRRNMLDLALYQRAAALFHARVHATEAGSAADGHAVFTPVLDQITGIADIPGRQGFEPVEDTEVGWLLPDRPARIFFRTLAGAARIVLKFRCLTADYPIENIVVTVNGERVAQSTQRHEPHWFTLQATPPNFRDEVNLLAIDPPVFLPVRQVSPDAAVQRYLSVALANITFAA